MTDTPTPAPLVPSQRENPTASELQSAFDRGMGSRGVSHHRENPYSPDNEELLHQAWDSGWDAENSRLHGANRVERSTPAPLAVSQRAIEIERAMIRDLDMRRVLALARAAKFLNVAAGNGVVLGGLDAADLYTDTIVALGIEDAAFVDVVIEAAIESPEAHSLMARAERSNPVGDMDRPAILAAARAWWAANMPMSICRYIQISGDGRVNVHWQDADESGKYTLPVGFFNRSNPGADVERLRVALEPFARLADIAELGRRWAADTGFTVMHHHYFVGSITLRELQDAREALATPTRAENAQVRGEKGQ